VDEGLYNGMGDWGSWLIDNWDERVERKMGT